MATIDVAALRRLLTAHEIEAWLTTAHPGDKAIYYTGRLAADRDDLKAPSDARLETIMKAAFAADRAEHGAAILAQAPAPTLGYHYIIIKPSRPRRGNQS